MGVRGRKKVKGTGNPWWVFISHYWKESTKENCLTNLNNHIYLVLGSTPINEIKRKELL